MIGKDVVRLKVPKDDPKVVAVFEQYSFMSEYEHEGENYLRVHMVDDLVFAAHPLCFQLMSRDLAEQADLASVGHLDTKRNWPPMPESYLRAQKNHFISN